MSTFTKRVLAAALTGALVLPTVQIAEAGPRDGWRGHHGHPGKHRPHKPYRKHHKKKKDHDVGAAVAAGIIGLAAGAILLGATSQPSYAAPPPPPYYPPAPAPGPVYGPGPGYHPWSPAWYDYCHRKYRSFEPDTGLYTTYRGTKRFCQ